MTVLCAPVDVLSGLMSPVSLGHVHVRVHVHVQATLWYVPYLVYVYARSCEYARVV